MSSPVMSPRQRRKWDIDPASPHPIARRGFPAATTSPSKEEVAKDVGNSGDHAASHAGTHAVSSTVGTVDNTDRQLGRKPVSGNSAAGRADHELQAAVERAMRMDSVIRERLRPSETAQRRLEFKEEPTLPPALTGKDTKPQIDGHDRRAKEASEGAGPANDQATRRPITRAVSLGHGSTPGTSHKPPNPFRSHSFSGGHAHLSSTSSIRHGGNASGSTGLPEHRAIDQHKLDDDTKSDSGSIISEAARDTSVAASEEFTGPRPVTGVPAGGAAKPQGKAVQPRDGSSELRLRALEAENASLRVELRHQKEATAALRSEIKSRDKALGEARNIAVEARLMEEQAKRDRDAAVRKQKAAGARAKELVAEVVELLPLIMDLLKAYRERRERSSQSAARRRQGAPGGAPSDTPATAAEAGAAAALMTTPEPQPTGRTEAFPTTGATRASFLASPVVPSPLFSELDAGSRNATPATLRKSDAGQSQAYDPTPTMPGSRFAGRGTDDRSGPGGLDGSSLVREADDSISSMSREEQDRVVLASVAASAEQAYAKLASNSFRGVAPAAAPYASSGAMGVPPEDLVVARAREAAQAPWDDGAAHSADDSVSLSGSESVSSSVFMPAIPVVAAARAHEFHGSSSSAASHAAPAVVPAADSKHPAQARLAQPSWQRQQGPSLATVRTESNLHPLTATPPPEAGKLGSWQGKGPGKPSGPEDAPLGNGHWENGRSKMVARGPGGVAASQAGSLNGPTTTGWSSGPRVGVSKAAPVSLMPPPASQRPTWALPPDDGGILSRIMAPGIAERANSTAASSMMGIPGPTPPSFKAPGGHSGWLSPLPPHPTGRSQAGAYGQGASGASQRGDHGRTLQGSESLWQDARAAYGAPEESRDRSGRAVDEGNRSRTSRGVPPAGQGMVSDTGGLPGGSRRLSEGGYGCGNQEGGTQGGWGGAGASGRISDLTSSGRRSGGRVTAAEVFARAEQEYPAATWQVPDASTGPAAEALSSTWPRTRHPLGGGGPVAGGGVDQAASAAVELAQRQAYALPNQGRFG